MHFRDKLHVPIKGKYITAHKIRSINKNNISFERKLSHPTRIYFGLTCSSSSREVSLTSSSMSSLPFSLWVLKFWYICVVFSRVFFGLLRLACGVLLDRGVLLDCILEGPGLSKLVSPMVTALSIVRSFFCVSIFSGLVVSLFDEPLVDSSFVTSSFRMSFRRIILLTGCRIWDRKLSKYREIFLFSSCFRLAVVRCFLRSIHREIRVAVSGRQPQPLSSNTLNFVREC